MTLPDSSQAFGQIVRVVVTAIRRATEEQEPQDQVDRILAATALAVGAAAILWPQGRKAPAVISAGAEIARHVWRRRDWFLPGR